MILQITIDELTTIENDALGLVLQAILRVFWFELKFKCFVYFTVKQASRVKHPQNVCGNQMGLSARHSRLHILPGIP